MKLIIDSSNLMSTTSVKALETHLRHGAENDAVSMVQGSWRGLHITVKGALENGQKFSFKHIILAPYENTTRQQVMDTILPALCREFGLDAAKLTIVEHQKARGGDPNACCLHWHVMAPWYNAGKNRAHDFSFDFMRQSKVAQLAAFKLGHAFVLCRHHVEIIESLRADGENACADALEAAFPIGARPDNATVPLPIVQAAAAKGRDMIQTRSVIRMAERNTNSGDELRDELKKHGLLIVVGKLSPPAWVVIDATSGEVVGKLAGLAHCTVAKIIKRLGEPKNEYPLENGGADERGEVAGWRREPDQFELLAGAGDSGAGGPGAGSQPGHGAASAEVFVAALNATENDLRVQAIYEKSLALAAGALVKALAFWTTIETQTRTWLASLATRELPATAVVENSRKHMAAADARLERYQDRLRELQGDLTFAYLQPQPPAVGLAAHQARLRKMEAQRDKIARATKRVQAERDGIAKNHQQYEHYDARLQREFRAQVIEPKQEYGKRILAVLNRCRALVASYPENLVLGGLALFRFGLFEAQKAPPDAKWHVDGHDGPDSPDYNSPGGDFKF